MDFWCLPPSGDDDDPLKLCTVHFPLQIWWPPHVRHVKQRGSIFSNPSAFSAYAEACSTIALLSQILGNSVVVSAGGRVEHLRLAMLMRTADDANDDQRQHINDLLKLLLADDLMQHGFGYPPQNRIDGNDRRVFALRIDVQKRCDFSGSGGIDDKADDDADDDADDAAATLEVLPFPPSWQLVGTFDVTINVCVRAARARKHAFFWRGNAVQGISARVPLAKVLKLLSLLSPSLHLQASAAEAMERLAVAEESMQPGFMSTDVSLRHLTALVRPTAQSLDTLRPAANNADSEEAEEAEEAIAEASEGFRPPLLPHQINVVAHMRRREAREPLHERMWIPLTADLEYNPFFQLMQRRLPQRAPLATAGFICDDVGMGKTRSILAFLLQLPQAERGQTLVVCPLSVVDTWQQEAQTLRRAGRGDDDEALSVALFHGARRALPSTADVVVTTLQTVLYDFKALAPCLAHVRWKRCVVDESHQMTGAATVRAMRAISATHKWAVTATPAGSHDRAWLNQLLWLGLDVPRAAYAENQLLYAGFYRIAAQEGGLQWRCQRAQELMRQLAVSTPRPRNQDPPLRRSVVRLPLTCESSYGLAVQRCAARVCQQRASGALVAQTFQQLRSYVSRGAVGTYESVERRETVQTLTADEAAMFPLSGDCCSICLADKESPVVLVSCGHQYCQLCIEAVAASAAGRQQAAPCPLCRRPFALENLRRYSGVAPEERWESSPTLPSKFEHLVRWCHEHADRRAVVFSEFDATLQQAADVLASAGVAVYQLKGSMTRVARQRQLRAFQETAGGGMFLLRIKGNSVGLNLQCSSTIIFLEPVVNGTLVRQAVGRVQRIGQQAEALDVITFAYQHTFEETLLPHMERAITFGTSSWRPTRANVEQILCI